MTNQRTVLWLWQCLEYIIVRNVWDAKVWGFWPWSINSQVLLRRASTEDYMKTSSFSVLWFGVTCDILQISSRIILKKFLDYCEWSYSIIWWYFLLWRYGYIKFILPSLLWAVIKFCRPTESTILEHKASETCYDSLFLKSLCMKFTLTWRITRKHVNENKGWN